MTTNQNNPTTITQATRTDDVEDASVEIGDKRFVIRITDYDARQLKPLGFHVYDFHESDETVAALFGPSSLLSDVLVYFCKPDDEETFFKSLDGETMEAARVALRNAIVNFFPVANRKNVLKVYESILRAVEATEEASND